MFVREKRINGYTYLYLVETVREDGRTRQRIIRNLGRKEAVLASGALDRLAASVGRFAERAFGIGRVCVVADRGMISGPTIAALETRGLEYVLGVRERTDKRVRETVLDDPGPFTPLLARRQGGETQLFAKEVVVDGIRYVVCRNEAEAEKDRADRQAIVEGLERQLKKGDKALIGNAAYRRYLRRPATNPGAGGTPAFEIDPGKLAEEARYDGIFVLRTNLRRLQDAVAEHEAHLPALVVSLCKLLTDEIRRPTAHIDDLTLRIRQEIQANETAQRLSAIPGIGPITAMTLAALAPPADMFRKGRDFAAWVGLTPRQHSTGGKTRLGKTSKMGQKDIRRLLIVGAMAVIQAAGRTGGPKPGSWLSRMLSCKPRMLVAVALANKMARVAWALISRGEAYRIPA